MSQIKVNDVLLEFDFAQSHAFAAKPITMLYLVHISIYRPVVEERWQDLMPRENAKAWSNNTRIKIVRIWILHNDSFLDLFVVVFAPNFLQTNDVIVAMS